MALITFEDVSFFYPEQTMPALKHISFQAEAGEFLVLCGPSGCGKTTLLKQLKPVLVPGGMRSGAVRFHGQSIEEVSAREQAARIGYVFQSPENQIVTDKVWHELAFGLESLGYESSEIRRRVVEIATFFGIQNWFYEEITHLSGGQKQLLNLAAIMTMQPEVIVLDEPTSQLDPIAASDFLNTLAKINRELGTTILIIEQRLEEVFPLADRVLVMSKDGELICEGEPRKVGMELRTSKSVMFQAMPTAMRIWNGIANEQECPVTIREGREFLTVLAKEQTPQELPEEKEEGLSGETKPCVLEAENIWFRYEQNGPDIIKGMKLSLHKGEWLCLLGGNGTGKTTAIKVLSGLQKPYRGTVTTREEIGYLPQNPQTLFVKKTVEADLREVLTGQQSEKEERLRDMIKLCRLTGLEQRHPYDLSGGEQQRLGLAKVLLRQPGILLLDEPTKGLDIEMKCILAEVLQELLQQGIAILMVSHDVEFCAAYAKQCALFFDGAIVTQDTPRRFFSGNSFYTTAANRIARAFLPQAVVAEDVILAFGGEAEKPDKKTEERLDTKREKTITEHTVCGQENETGYEEATSSVQPKQNRKSQKPKLPMRTCVATVMILLLIPITLYFGVRTGRYNVSSVLVLLECMMPFFLVYEGKKPKPRELVVIAVLCAIGVAGRAAFFMLPQFKPVMALTIIAGVAMGAETGFLVGAMTMLVSNILFSQGPWTPWQMFAMGIVGFLAGLLFRKGRLPANRLTLCIFGGLAALVIYGGIMNPAAALVWGNQSLNRNILIAYYISGFPMDCIHGFATIVFLLLAAKPMIEKLERIEKKYGFPQVAD